MRVPCTKDRSFDLNDGVNNNKIVTQLMCPPFKSSTRIIQFRISKIDESGMMSLVPVEREEFGGDGNNRNQLLSPGGGR